MSRDDERGAGASVAEQRLPGGTVASTASDNAAPSISLPKGGGAISGIGEKFATNPVTGTGSLSVPIPTSPGRAGFGPQLSLSYDSGAGNGPFGFGWSLSLPNITRKTDKGLPRYEDSAESDVFVLSGAEDLVPVLGTNGERHVDDTSAPGFSVQQYRPRIEGSFARIERWTNRETGEIHWRSISRDNVTSLYGRDNSSRVFAPTEPDLAHPQRIYSWLICASYDDKGNAIVYEYASEDDAGVDLSRSNERNRIRGAVRYLKRIKYGNRTSRLLEPDLTRNSWLFEVVFDYGEGHCSALPLDPTRAPAAQHQFVHARHVPAQKWAARPDAFSTHRPGFELRSHRRCQRVLMFHRFAELNQNRLAELGDEPYLVRSVEFDYADLDYGTAPDVDAERAHQGSTRYASFIQKVTQCGFVRDDSKPVLETAGSKALTYLKRALPALELEYSKAELRGDVRALDPTSAENLPIGVDGSAYQWVDLDGEGAPGILSRHSGAWYYKPSLGGGQFGGLQVLRTQPSLFALASGGTQLVDLSGDGQLDVVSFDGATPGFYERDAHGSWQTFRELRHVPNVRFDDPNLKLIDLNGDGHADLLISEHDVFTWYPSLAEDGFGPPRSTPCPHDEERGPRLLFADGTQSVYLADLCGDGLTDLVRIRNGEVCYWPNLGYGRFGAKVAMDDAPWFDNPDQFDQRRIRLADIDGSGAVDIIYLHRDGVRVYFNQSGNRWTRARELIAFPQVDGTAAISTADLLGNGTACLVWSSSLPGDAARALRYVDLMGGKKPHLLVRSKNNLGAETEVEYASSTKFYFADKLAGRPWITRLAFPVHVVERLTTLDRISGNRFVTEYAYHHGYFDGEEREFRGFGLVEQLDTASFAGFQSSAQPGASNVDASSHVPPVLTKSWFHTGAHLERNHISDYFAGLLDEHDPGEYFREPGLSDAQARARLLPDTVLPAGLSSGEEREACRALKGMMLRQEVYALDAGEGASPAEQQRAATPYTVVEQNFTLEQVQPRGLNRHAIFFAHPREALTHHYERNPSDPRISHAITLEVDGFGNVLRSLAIGYGRRQASTDPNLTEDDRFQQTRQRPDSKRRPLITYTHSRYTQNSLPTATRSFDHHRAPLPAEVRAYELTGFEPDRGAERFTFEEWARDQFAPLSAAAEIPYEQRADDNLRQKRLIEQVRTLYRKDDLSGLSPLGQVEGLALSGETYKLALTPGLIARVFKRKRSGQPDEALLATPATILEGKGPDQGGYAAMDGNWWIPSGRVYFDAAANVTSPAVSAAAELAVARQHFFTAQGAVDAFGQRTLIAHDGYDLLPIRTTDPVGNVVSATNDYRVLQPREVTDANRNRSASLFDALGMVTATAVMGKPGQAAGDTLDELAPDLTPVDVRAFVANPTTRAALLLGRATTRVVYDVDRFARIGQPPLVATLARETHFSPARDNKTKIQLAFSFSDGFGREIQKKLQAEPGKAPQRAGTLSLASGDVRPGALVQGPQGVAQADTSPRWVGTGRTAFNNKGKPVKKYEPFFSGTHLYEDEAEVTDTGVSPVLFYDPVDRVVATLHPNHTYEKVIFDPWQQTTFDVNDTVAPKGTQTGDPRTDPDIAGLVRRYFAAQPASWQTWFASRSAGAAGAAEQAAAKKAAAHANTPTIAHFDALGRAFVTFAHNAVACPGHTLDGREDRFATRTVLDIEGNQRAVRDAVRGNASGDELGRVVMRYDYDLLGTRIHHASMEAGERWTLNDAAGKPIRAWDSRGFQRRLSYDAGRRLIELYVTEAGAERLAERTVYGEAQGDAANHRGRVFQQFDAAGVVTSVAYDFNGNLTQGRRQLLPDYKNGVNWLQNPATSDGSYETSTSYDALNRPLAVTSPDGSVYLPTFNEANLLNRVDVRLRGAATATRFIANIDYNTKGQRERIDYGNGASTSYSYDPLTFRLTRLKTTRPATADLTASQLFSNARVVQDLRYTYDPVGNITRLQDAALKSISRGGQNVEPVAEYTYDAVYRLVEATGREHIGQTAFDFNPANGDCRDYPFGGNHVNANDLQALRNYTERYEYDAVGNFSAFVHLADNAGWTRRYDYQEASLLEAGKRSNRLSKTTLGNTLNLVESYTHDQHGNMTSMPHLAAMDWTYKDELCHVSLGGGGHAYYVYDSSGQRVRKVIESLNGARQKERIYLGGFEIYRELGGNQGAISLARESLHILDDKQRIALVETQTIANGSAVAAPVQVQRYQLSNNLGSASVELDDRGALLGYEEYHPYGTSAFQAGRSAAEVSLKRYRYVGKERDDETAFVVYERRYYVPWLGRWTACDPLFTSGAPNLYQFVSNNPVTHHDVAGMYDPSAFGKSLEATVDAAEHALLLEDRNVGTSIANTTIATAATVAKGFLSIFQVGTGAAQGVEDIKRGMSDEGDGWDIAIGASRILSDAGEVASTALGVAGAGEKLVAKGQVALLNREIKVAQAERNAAKAANGNLKASSEALGELNAKKQFIEAGYSRPFSLKEPKQIAQKGPGDVKRVADNGGKVSQGVDQSYRSVKPGHSKDVVVEAKGLQSPNKSNPAKNLKEDTRQLVEGADDWNLDRLQTAAGSGNKNAEDLLRRLGGEAPESYLSVTNSAKGGTTIYRLEGATGRPTATLLPALDNVSPVLDAVGTSALNAEARGWLGANAQGQLR